MSMQRHGLCCPKCGERMKVYYSRPGDGLIKRRRVCLPCGYAETTHERPVGVPRLGDSSTCGTKPAVSTESRTLFT